ncbi:MAG TPA: DUF1844 domain-containing protein [Nitrospinaceae bacterium]|jgi:hypothetical protein|nr:DUF1844 domain-containing protein [Alphaproteobacteria bacterium]HIB44465.1 DUF1844 domain-containing protein [Nitrospina sp.]HIN88174.1 DUF1844 domain-containing protein [Nitrospinaceae bacterium]HIO23759.1 DUF1844 domain-containing protein [Nitrospinaceae bacterium]|tara:strand:- start:778 stop:1179 length:402 start_codon:yes stop_codon:yes gene_type:complete
MSKKEPVEGEGFVIKDKRSSQISEDAATFLDDQETKDQEEQTDSSKEKETESFQIDFSTFIMSLTSSAFYHLGDMPDPSTGKKEVNLPAVQQTIDMLVMLREKTKGNLKEDEEKLIEQLIYELQVKYVAKTKE